MKSPVIEGENMHPFVGRSPSPPRSRPRVLQVLLVSLLASLGAMGCGGGASRDSDDTSEAKLGGTADPDETVHGCGSSCAPTTLPLCADATVSAPITTPVTFGSFTTTDPGPLGLFGDRAIVMLD